MKQAPASGRASALRVNIATTSTPIFKTATRRAGSRSALRSKNRAIQVPGTREAASRREAEVFSRRAKALKMHSPSRPGLHLVLCAKTSPPTKMKKVMVFCLSDSERSDEPARLLALTGKSATQSRSPPTRPATSDPNASECATQNEEDVQQQKNPTVCSMLDDLGHCRFTSDSAADRVELPILHVGKSYQKHVTRESATKTEQDDQPPSWATARANVWRFC
ncbi:MAG: hypothetical protein R3C17_13280 [Planctomycetaceae bacterium]